MSNYTTLTVDPEVGEKFRQHREERGEDTTDTLRHLLQQATQ